jgi:hypothetical protein
MTAQQAKTTAATHSRCGGGGRPRVGPRPERAYHHRRDARTTPSSADRVHIAEHTSAPSPPDLDTPRRPSSRTSRSLGE